MWFDDRGNLRIGDCATDGCRGHAAFWLEFGGIGSNYCAKCKERIVRDQEEDKEPDDPRRDCPWKCKPDDRKCICANQQFTREA